MSTLHAHTGAFVAVHWPTQAAERDRIEAVRKMSAHYDESLDASIDSDSDDDGEAERILSASAPNCITPADVSALACINRCFSACLPHTNLIQHPLAPQVVSAFACLAPSWFSVCLHHTELFQRGCGFLLLSLLHLSTHSSSHCLSRLPRQHRQTWTRRSSCN